MQARQLRKLSGRFVLCLCLALCYVSLKISSLTIESLESLESLQSVESVNNVDNLKSVDSLESQDIMESLSNRQAEALPSVLRVDQWPHGIR